MPFVTHGKIYFSLVVASPLPGKNPIPVSQHQGYLPFPGSKLKLTSKTYPEGNARHHGGGGDHASGIRSYPTGVVTTTPGINLIPLVVPKSLEFPSG